MTYSPTWQGEPLKGREEVLRPVKALFTGDQRDDVSLDRIADLSPFFGKAEAILSPIIDLCSTTCVH